MPNDVQAGDVTFAPEDVKFSVGVSGNWIPFGEPLIANVGDELYVQITLTNTNETVQANAVEVKFFQGEADSSGENPTNEITMPPNIFLNVTTDIVAAAEAFVEGNWSLPDSVESEWHSVVVEVSHDGSTARVNRAFRVFGVMDLSSPTGATGSTLTGTIGQSGLVGSGGISGGGISGGGITGGVGGDGGEITVIIGEGDDIDIHELEPLDAPRDWDAFISDDNGERFPSGYGNSPPIHLGDAGTFGFIFSAGPNPVPPCLFEWWWDAYGAETNPNQPDGSQMVHVGDGPVHKYHQYEDGIYSVALLVTDFGGEERTDILNVTVGDIRPKDGEESPQDYSDYWNEISAEVADLMNSAITPGVEGESLSWLARRRALKGIPFQYLVPTEDALPPETIRFFHIDRNWIDALIDGCLSVALTTSRERKWLLEEREDPWATAQQGSYQIPSQVSDMCFEDFDINGDGVLNVLDIVGWISAGETQGSPIIENLQKIITGDIPTPAPRSVPTITNYEYTMRKLNSLEMWYRGMYYNTLYNQSTSGQTYFTTGGRLTGMLFRSTIVRDFPGIEISAFAHDPTRGIDPWTAGNLIQIIRMERLSESIMLCIFNGLPTHLRIQEPSEGIRMGVDVQTDGLNVPANYEYKLKMKNDEGSVFTGTPSPSVVVDTRPNSADADVLDIQRIFDNLKNDTTVNPFSLFPADSVSAFFATQFLQFPYQQDFVPLPHVASDHPDINFPHGGI